MTEADPCRRFVVPLLQEAGWNKVTPLWRHGNVAEIAQKFGGVDELRNAVHQLQTLPYGS